MKSHHISVEISHTATTYLSGQHLINTLKQTFLCHIPHYTIFLNKQDDLQKKRTRNGAPDPVKIR